MGLAAAQLTNKVQLIMPFMQKLPATYLYDIDVSDNRYIYIGDRTLDWCGFLSRRDVLRGSKLSGTQIREFSYISYSRKGFLDVLTPHMGSCIRSFIDVGCGGGDKLKLVKSVWPDVAVYGVEHDPAMGIWAAEFGHVFIQDARLIDYSMFDLIYAYWPIADDIGMRQLVEQIMSTKNPQSPFICLGACQKPLEGFSSIIRGC